MSFRPPVPLPIAAALLAVASLGCQGDDGIAPPPTGSETLSWSFTGLEPLGPGFVYEAWVVVAGVPVSAGRFDIGAGGVPSVGGRDLSPEDAAAATAFVLTIEPAVGDDPAPSATKVLAGELAGGVATLSVGHPAALGDGFAAAGGSFILETPTTAGVAGDYRQGIWWLDPAAGPGPSLALPSLPAGWVYEGWVVVGGTPRTTGRFSAPAGADADGPGPAAGPDPAPPFPGQDFISPPLDLVGATAVISVEPVPDDSPAPFALKPLTAAVADAGAGALQVMTNRSGALPTGTATLQ